MALPPDLERHVRVVRKGVEDARIHLLIWEQMTSTPERAQQFNNYLGFFWPTREAHRKLLFMEIAKLFDGRKGMANISNLVREMTRVTALPTVQIGRLRKHKRQLDSQGDLVRRIRRARHVQGAHRPQAEPTLEPASLGEVRALLELLMNASDELFSAAGFNPVAWRRFGAWSDDHTAAVFEALKDRDRYWQGLASGKIDLRLMHEPEVQVAPNLPEANEGDTC